MLNFLIAKTLSFIKFNTSFIGPFTHPNNISFNFSNTEVPSVTIDRGLYFHQNSLLVSSTSFILPPEFCLYIVVKFKAAGKVLEISDNLTTYIKLSFDGINLIYEVLMSNITGKFIASYSAPRDLNSWIFILMILKQNIGYSTISAGGPNLKIMGEFRMDSQDTVLGC